jgi:hypothetical protein
MNQTRSDFVEADFDEVVTGAKRAEVLVVVGVLETWMPVGDAL